MDLVEKWENLGLLCRSAERFPTMQVWAFGSMLWSTRPRDLDVLIVYNDRADVVALRDMALWEVTIPKIEIIAMTPEEEHHYRFIKVTGARRLHPR